MATYQLDKNAKYAKTHEWVRIEDGVAVVGITDAAQDMLSDVVYVDRVEGIRWNQIVAQVLPTIQLLNIFDGSLNVQPFRSFP